MTRDQAIARIRRRLGFRKDLLVDIQTELDVQQRELERWKETPWFLKTTLEFQNDYVRDSGGTPVTPTQYEDFLEMPDTRPLVMMYEYGGLWYKETTETEDEWKKLERAEFEATVGKLASGNPPCYYDPDEVGQIQIMPRPDNIYDFRLIAYVGDYLLSELDVPETSRTNRWLTYAPELLCWKVVEVLAGDLGMEAKLNEAALRVKSLQTELDHEKIARLEHDRLRSMGEC